MAIILKTQDQIDGIREGGHMLGSIVDLVIERVAPGANTKDLDAFAEEEMRKAGGIPAFKGYKPDFSSGAFPCSLCTSINDELVHGIASAGRVLNEGDVLGIDVGFEYNGFFTDMARTVPVGSVSKDAQRLLRGTQEALDAAIGAIKEGEELYAIGEAVEEVAARHKLSIIEDLVGHGVGVKIHEDPNVPNFRSTYGKKHRFQRGMVLAIEPMLALGSSELYTKKDDWTIATKDGSLSAQFEHTVAINHDGSVEILTPTQWRFKY